MINKIKELIEDGIKLKKIFTNDSLGFNKYKKEYFNWINNYKDVIEHVEGKDSNRYKNFCIWISNLENINDIYFDVLIGFLKGIESSI